MYNKIRPTQGQLPGGAAREQAPSHLQTLGETVGEELGGDLLHLGDEPVHEGLAIHHPLNTPGVGGGAELQPPVLLPPAIVRVTLDCELTVGASSLGGLRRTLKQ